jgi:flavin reductase (DIM6/NTAB) family NADH-FMN oxidoreductase RutF
MATLINMKGVTRMPTPASSDAFVTLDTQTLPFAQAYKLMIGSIVPRPIAWVSTLSPSGVPNLAPFSFFNGVCSNPPSLLFCPVRRGTDGAKKDTLTNLEANGEFVVNVVTEHNVGLMNQTSAEYPPEVSEFTEAGVTPLPSVLVKPPRVAESPIHFECKLLQVVPVGDGSVGSGCVVIGEIVRFHAHETVYQNGRIDLAALAPVARLAGSAYCPVRDVFELARPTL